MRSGFRKRGMTLIEVVISAGLATVLMGGMVSALVLSSRALKKRNDVSSKPSTASPCGPKRFLTTCALTNSRGCVLS